MTFDMEYKAGDHITFRDANKTIKHGEWVNEETYPGDLVAVRDGFFFRLYELSIGCLLSNNAEGATPHEAYENFVHEMGKKNRTPTMIIQKLHEKLENKYTDWKLINESPAYSKYLKQQQAIEAALPDLYNEQEIADMTELANEAIGRITPRTQEFIEQLIVMKDNSKRTKIPIDRLRGMVATEEEQNDVRDRMAKGLPLKNIEVIPPTPETFQCFMEGISKKAFAKLKEQPRVYDILFKAYSVLKDAQNELGYAPKNNQHLDKVCELMLYIAGGMNARSLARIEATPGYIEELSALLTT